MDFRLHRIVLITIFLVCIIEAERGHRLARFLSFFTIIQFDHKPCTSASNQTGVCMTAKDCKKHMGEPSGSCASNYGVCCVYNLTCNHETRENISYFQSPDFPHPMTNTTENCTFTIHKNNDNICQIRLDFLDFNLTSPIRSSCEEDNFKIPNVENGPLCGINKGQHVYIHLDKNTSSVPLSINYGQAEFNRTWNIVIHQISCESHLKAPDGCLQYFMGKTGQIKSFNFEGEKNDSRHLADQRYTICIKNEMDSCGIKWKAMDSTSFDIAGSLGTSTTRPAEDQCTKDYVLIPRHSKDGNEPTADRQCGQRLSPTDNVGNNSPIISKMLPYVLGFFTDKTEISGETNAGFFLEYEQLEDCE